MNISKADKRILDLILKERESILSRPKSYRWQADIDKLTQAANGIRNTIVYQGIEAKSVESNPVSAQKGTIVLKRGESISLRMY